MDNIEDILRALAEDSPQEDNDNSQDNPGSDESSGEGLFSGLDLGTIAKAASLLGAAGSTSDNEKLLLALKPLLREENRTKVDTVVKFLKLISLLPLLKDSGLFGS